jgi:hypothetical protein
MLIDRARLALNDENRMTIAGEALGGGWLFVVDDFYKDPDYVRALSLSLDFTIESGFFPGRRAAISIGTAHIMDLVNRLYQRRFGAHERLLLEPRFQSMEFAMMLETGGDLNPVQCQAHYDAGHEIAAIVYLNPPEQCRGGTSFWRYRERDLSRAPPPEVMAALVSELGGDPSQMPGNIAEFFLLGLLAPHLGRFSGMLMTESNEVWELTRLVEMKYNRFIMYDAKLFHTAHVEPGAFGETKESRRLTQNIFFERRGR